MPKNQPIYVHLPVCSRELTVLFPCWVFAAPKGRQPSRSRNSSGDPGHSAPPTSALSGRPARLLDYFLIDVLIFSVNSYTQKSKTRSDSINHDLFPMEVCQYTEETLEAAIRKFEGFGKTLVFKPSRDMAATKSTKDLYFEEMERYIQARLASEVKIGTSYRLLRGYPGTKDVFNKKGDAVRPSTSVKLQLETNVQDIIKLTNVTICPKVGGQGGKIIMGTLEAHVNGFRYKTSDAHTNIDVVYENIKCPFFRAGDHEIPPLLHLHLHNQIILGTEETNDINFQLDSTLVQTDGRNKDLQDFVDKVTDLWESKPTVINYYESPEYEFHGFFPQGRGLSLH
ncbi:hypothetical protein MKX03_007768 [Papaver bracteatum]|nr:hypothetical protein MKX03_007768 [Papaver bracteatum]